jgi:hypothetical protein
MRIFTLITGLLLIIIIACKRESENILPIESEIVVDTIRNMPAGTLIDFHLEINGGKPPYSVTWITPSGNSGTGPFSMYIVNNYKFAYIVNDALFQDDMEPKIDTFVIDLDTVLNDPSKYFYDFRNAYVGQYACKVKKTRLTFPTETLISSYNSNILVIKSSSSQDIEFTFESVTYVLSPASSTYLRLKGSNAVCECRRCYFYPAKDSVSFYNYNGGWSQADITRFNGKK